MAGGVLTKEAEDEDSPAAAGGEASDGGAREREVGRLLDDAAGALARLLLDEWRATYGASVDGLRQAYAALLEGLAADGALAADDALSAFGEAAEVAGEGIGPVVGALAGNPLTAEVEQGLGELAQRTAQNRLARYGERLRALLATNPDADALAGWLVERARGDAGAWARLDSLAIRRQARRDFYDANPPPPGRWTIQPEEAAEPACRHVAGRIYDSYAEAEEALDGAWHPNCVHYVERAYGVRERPRSSDEQDQAPEPAQQGEPSGTADHLLPPRLRAVRAAEDQIRADRNETAVAVDRVGNEILRKKGYRTRVEITRRERDLIYGKTLTHNHPTGWLYPPDDPRHAGTSFTLDDIELAAWAHLFEIRAVTPRYRYSMRPGPKGWPDEARLRAAYTRARRQVMQRLKRAVAAGTMTGHELDAELDDEIWKVLADQFGLIYSREQ